VRCRNGRNEGGGGEATWPALLLPAASMMMQTRTDAPNIPMLRNKTGKKRKRRERRDATGGRGGYLIFFTVSSDRVRRLWARRTQPRAEGIGRHVA